MTSPRSVMDEILRPLRPGTHAAVDDEFIRAQIRNSIAVMAADDPLWLPVLTEEVGEVARALLDHRSGHHYPVHRTRCQLARELVQVAAVALAWVEALDRDGA